MTRHVSRFLSHVSRLTPHSHLLLVWLIILPAAMPLIQPTLTRSADGLLHLYRVVALQHALQQSQTLFPRWLPDLAYGYGFPLFVFYAPLSYYLTLALSLAGLGTILAVNASFLLALFVAGTGAYLFARELLGPRAGLLATVAYVYAPFQLLNTLSRGGLSAAWAMAVFPLVFWIFTRLIYFTVKVRFHTPSKHKKNSPLPPYPSAPLLPRSSAPLLQLLGRLSANLNPRLIAMSALILGTALLMHNTLSLLFVPLVGFYLGLGLLRQAVRGRFWQVAFKLGLAIALGVGLAAFFLLPAIIEKDFAQVHRVITSPDFDFRFNFVTLNELFQLPPPANTGLLNPNFPRTLGLAQVGLATLGLSGLCASIIKNLPRPPAPLLHLFVFTLVSLGGALFLMLPNSIGVWERLPLLAFVQFPHRLLGPTALVLALLAGAAATTWPKQSSFGITFVGVVLVFVTAVPLLYPRYYNPLPTKPTLLGMMAYEHASGAIGTTSFGEYLPVWVKQVPRESPLEPMYQDGATLQRLDPAYLPAEARIESANYGFNQVDLVINAPEPYQAIFHTFYFPGWQAQIDGQPAAIAPVSERGLIGVSVPAGRHQIQLRFQETALRRVANIVSIGSLAVIATMVVACCVLRIPFTTTHYGIRNTSSLRATSGGGFSHAQLLILTGLAFILIGAKTLYFDRFDTSLKRTFDGATVPHADVSTQVNFGHRINLLGYSLNRTVIEPGQSFKLTVYWQARQPLTTNYSALAQLVDAQGHLYAGQDNLHPGSFKTTLWQLWGFVQDPHTIAVPPGTPPGDYFLVTGLYNPTTWVRLPVVSGGDPRWSEVMAIPVSITRPSHPFQLDELEIAWPIEANFGAELQLLGATPERDLIPRQDFLRIALFWQARKTPTADYQIGLRLVGPDGHVAMQETTHPSHNRYPTTRWAAGERVRDNHALWIPPDFPPGTYRVQVQVIDKKKEPVGEWVDLGQLKTAK